jgi:YaiO family outer membrane protein
MRMLLLSLILLSGRTVLGADALADARELVNQGRTKDAIAYLTQHVSEAPDDLDARVLLGLICSWDGRWEDGRRAFTAALASDPDYKDAVLGLINLELWSGHPALAKELAVKAIAARPQDLEYKAALAKVDAALAPARAEAASPSTGDEPNWETGVAESTIFYSDKRSSWHETAVNISRRFTAGWVTATISHANWFGENSNLIDLQSYPSLGKGRYAFFDAAFSPDHTLYAHRRFGAEIFQSLGKGFEASAGVRYMRFNDNVLLYTASVGKWFGNYWILARTYIEPSSTFVTSNSYQLQLRKYYNDADHFIGMRLGEGASPFEVQSINDLGIQHSASIAFESLWKFKNQMRLRASAGVARQTRLSIGPLWQYEADCTLYFRY